MAPMMTAEIGVTNAQGAVIATSPASIPFAMKVGSGLPVTRQVYAIAVTIAAPDASIVFAATTASRRSVPARVEPR